MDHQTIERQYNVLLRLLVLESDHPSFESYLCHLLVHEILLAMT